MKKALICGGSGFIGSHLARKLTREGYWVRTVDIQEYAYGDQDFADNYIIGDLRSKEVCRNVFSDHYFDEVYALAAWMGGAGVIFTGDNDAKVMYDSAMINLNIAYAAHKYGAKKVLFSSSACVYNQLNQAEPDNPNCAEDSAFPAYPDSPYGWEKIFSEILYESYFRNLGLDIRIARLHNVYGQLGSWDNGKEKVPAALCRKIAEAEDGGEIEIWGDGKQTRSFTYIEDCLIGFEKLMASSYHDPINIGSDEMISINDFAKMIMGVAGKNLTINNVPTNAEGVRGRCSDNTLIKKVLGWAPSTPLIEGITKTYAWISEQVKAKERV